MTVLTNQSQVRKLALLFTVTYLVSYMTRINYGAIVSEMERALAIPKSRISMAVTGSFITYGAGQILSGICGDRFSPKRLMTLALAVTSVMNLSLPFCRNEYQMLFVWCVNGLSQAFLWPPLVRLMAALLSERDYNRIVVKVSWGSSLGTILIYLLSPLLISLFQWRAVFFFSAVLGGAMTVFWSLFAPDIPRETPKKVEEKPKKATSLRLLLSPVMLAVMAAIVCQGMLRDGVTTWMPSYISETYHISSMISILTGVTLPLFGMVCMQAASTLYIKIFRDPLRCSAAVFFVGTVSAVGLFFSSGRSALLSVILSALFTGCMHGVNLMLICMVPAFFKNMGSVSTVSGVLNSCTYIGSALSTYGVAVFSERFGWGFTLLFWILTAAAGTVLCAASIRPWKRKVASSASES